MSMIDVLSVVSVISHVSSIRTRGRQAEVMKRTVTISNARYPMHSYLLYIPFRRIILTASGVLSGKSIHMCYMYFGKHANPSHIKCS
jgi:hypothetical protein